MFATPTSLAISLDKRKNPDMYTTAQPEAQSRSEMHAVKSEALRRLFGLESGALKVIPGVSTIRRASWLGGITSTRSDAPPGLGNWDNSCYQNSVLQGLSAFRSLTTYLEKSDAIKQQDSSTTAGSLRETMGNLNDVSNNGRRLWTPAKLKSMSSWQQQDAQEYFSKIMDDLEKETAKAMAADMPSEGLREVKTLEDKETAAANSTNTSEEPSSKPQKSAVPKTPLDGNLAQRVACLKCGFSEGLSMIPFNCLTVPLGNNSNYQLSQCLDSYTSLEEISGVECAKCTLLQQKTQLENLAKPKLIDSIAELVTSDAPASTVSLPPELRQMYMARLEAIQQALDESDFSDATLNKKCQVPKKARVSSTKTRQAVIARAPTNLVVHVNRSLFDEYSGAMRKNLAHVSYPKVLDLGPWCLGIQSPEDVPKEQWSMDPAKSMIAGGESNTSSQGLQYILRAAVCHYGRHENGHYICYREHPEVQEQGVEGSGKMKWWRLSDDDVSSVSEETVLGQGGVFMLFYERLETPLTPEKETIEERPAEDFQAPVKAKTEIETLPDHSEDEEPADLVQGIAAPESAAAAIPEALASSKSLLSVEAESELSVDAEQSDTESEATLQQPNAEVRSVPTPPTMRTARRESKKSRGGFEPAFRAVAAT